VPVKSRVDELAVTVPPLKSTDDPDTLHVPSPMIRISVPSPAPVKSRTPEIFIVGSFAAPVTVRSCVFAALRYTYPLKLRVPAPRVTVRADAAELL